MLIVECNEIGWLYLLRFVIFDKTMFESRESQYK